MIGYFNQLYNWTRRLGADLTTVRAASLDNLDAPVSSRLSHDTAISEFSAIIALLQNLQPVVGRQIFQDVGDVEFTVPVGVTKLFVTMIGCGSGGAISTGVGGANRYLGGGGGATILDFPYPTIQPGDVITGSIGAPGNHGGSGSLNIFGGNGGDVTFGILTAKGATGAKIDSGGVYALGIGGIKPTGIVDAYGFAGTNGQQGSYANPGYGGESPVGSLFNNAGRGTNGSPIGTVANGGVIVLRWE